MPGADPPGRDVGGTYEKSADAGAVQGSAGGPPGAVRKEERPTAMMWYGQICGIADAMRTMELVDYDQAQYIKDTAFVLYRNKGAEDEPC